MKNKIISFATMMSIIAVAFFSLNNAGGPGSGRSGSPVENGATCQGCHSTYSLNPDAYGSIAISGLTTYVPGTTYTITLTVNRNPANGSTPKYGFQGIVLVGTSSTVAGTLAVIDAGTKTISPGGVTYIEHNTPRASGVWTIRWTAPSTNVGNVTFYFSGNAVNGNFSSSGDYVYTKKFVIPATAAALTASISATNVTCNNMCNGSATVSATGGTSYSYLWSTGNQTTMTATGLCAGPYTVTVTTTSATTTASVSITQPSALTTTISSTSTSTSAGNGTATATPLGGTAPYTYLWNTTTQTTSTATGLISGTYTVTITDSKGCTVTNTVVVNSVVSVASAEFRNSVKIYPIPNNGEFYMDINVSLSSDYTIELSNVLGQIIYSEELKNFSGKYTKSFNVTSFGKGIYLVNIRSKENQLLRKVVVY